MDLKEAMQLARLKWEFLSRVDYDEIEKEIMSLYNTDDSDFVESVNGECMDLLYAEYPTFKDYMGGCALCELFNKDKDDCHQCVGCPLELVTVDQRIVPACCVEEHPFLIWEEKPSKKNAQAVLNLINQKIKEMNDIKEYVEGLKNANKAV